VGKLPDLKGRLPPEIKQAQEITGYFNDAANGAFVTC